MCYHSVALAAALLALSVGLGSATREGQRSSSTPQFRTSVELVQVFVAVTDKRGEPVIDLTRDDFEVTEAGQPQELAAFGRIELPMHAADPEGAALPAHVVATDVATNDITDSRVFVLVLDDLHTSPRRTPVVKGLVEQFVEQHVGDEDFVALLSTGGRGDLAQEFTTDKARVLRVADRFIGRQSAHRSDAERVYDVRAATHTLARLAEQMAELQGRRASLLLISEGVDYNIYDARDRESADVVAAMEDAIAALRRSGVVLYAIDPRGLITAEGDLVETNTYEADLQPSYDLIEAGPRATLNLSIQSLRHLSEATGGFAAVNRNDFDWAFGQILRDASNYYALGYYPTSSGTEGEFRDIQVRVRRPGVNVSARPGYVWHASEDTTPSDPPSGEILPNLARLLEAPLPSVGLPLRVQAIPRKSTKRQSRVLLVIEVGGRALEFASEGERFQERLEFALFTVDERGRRRNGTSATLDLKLTAHEVERVRLTGVRWLPMLELDPGRYQLRVAASSTETNLTGSAFLDLDVPRLASRPEVGGLALTSLPAALMITTGATDQLTELPGPPTATRTFVLGDVVTLSSEVYIPSPKVNHVDLTATLQREESLEPDIDKSVSLSNFRNQVQTGIFSFDTRELGVGRFHLRVFVQGEQQPRPAASTSIEIVEN